MNADTGNGVAMMADSDNGISVMNWALRRVAKEYSWNYKMQEDTGDELFLLGKLKGTASALQPYDEMKKTPGKVEEGTLNNLGYRLLFFREGI